MGRKGFTLVELTIVIAIVGILAAIAIPQFSMLMRKSNEAATKGNLGAIRSALAIYYGDNEGVVPTDDLTSLTLGRKYLNRIPNTFVEPWHRPGNVIGSGGVAAYNLSSADSTNWWYFSDQSEGVWGSIRVNCIHTDAKGVTWTTY